MTSSTDQEVTSWPELSLSCFKWSGPVVELAAVCFEEEEEINADEVGIKSVLVGYSSASEQIYSSAESEILEKKCFSQDRKVGFTLFLNKIK